MGNNNLDIFVHSDICRLKNGYFKNIRIIENDKKIFAMIHISSQGMFKYVAISVQKFREFHIRFFPGKK